MSFAFLGIMLVTPPPIKDSDCYWRRLTGRVFWFEQPPLDAQTARMGYAGRGVQQPGGSEPYQATVAFRKCVDLFSESRSQVAFALYQGMALAMPQGRRFPSRL